MTNIYCGNLLIDKNVVMSRSQAEHYFNPKIFIFVNIGIWVNMQTFPVFVKSYCSQ